MRQIPSRLFTLGLVPLVLGQVVLLSGCGGSNSDSALAAQDPPKDRIEALQRIHQANLKHDETAPINQKSEPKKTRGRR